MNAKQMRNTKQNCFSHSSASPRNDKQCSAKQCFANQTNRCLAGFASRSDLFRDNARLTKQRRKLIRFRYGLKYYSDNINLYMHIYNVLI